MEKSFFHRPAKKETLIVKREEKIKKIHQLRNHVTRAFPYWWLRIGEWLIILILFLINLYLFLPFFGKEDKINVFSAPVIPFLAKITAFLIPSNLFTNYTKYNYGIRIWLLVFMLFFPVSFYFLVREISQRRLTAFIASLISSLPISIFLATRVNLGLLGEDGAHIASLTLMPLACLFLLTFLKNGNFKLGVFCGLTTALVALTSVLGFFVLIVFSSFIAFSEMLLGGGRVKLLRFLTVLILAAGFSAFWYNPQFLIYLIFNSSQGKLLFQVLYKLLPLTFFLVPLFGAFGFLIFENKPELQPLFLALFLTTSFFFLSLGAAGFSQPSPLRFLPALGISLSFLLGILMVDLFDFLLYSSKIEKIKILNSYKKFFAFSFLGLVFGFVIFTVFNFGPALLALEESQILGVQAFDGTVGIWELRKSSVFENIFGYTISGLTALFVLAIKKRLRV